MQEANLISTIENALYDYVRNSKYPTATKLGMMFFISIGIMLVSYDYTMFFMSFIKFASIVIFVKFIVYFIAGLIVMYIGIAPIMGGHNKMEEYALKIDSLVGSEIKKSK
jgi:hypothetical protein